MPLRSPATINVTRMPAAITPAEIAINAFFLSKPKIHAASEPAHAPVPGRGIATNIAKGYIVDGTGDLRYWFDAPNNRTMLVPEPMTIGLMILGAVGLIRRR